MLAREEWAESCRDLLLKIEEQFRDSLVEIGEKV